MFLRIWFRRTLGDGRLLPVKGGGQLCWGRVSFRTMVACGWHPLRGYIMEISRFYGHLDSLCDGTDFLQMPTKNVTFEKFLMHFQPLLIQGAHISKLPGGRNPLANRCLCVLLTPPWCDPCRWCTCRSIVWVKREHVFSITRRKGRGGGHFCPELLCVGGRLQKPQKALGLASKRPLSVEKLPRPPHR